MTSELAVLLRAGLPLDKGLKVLIDMAVRPQMAQLLSDLLSAVKGGKALSQAMQPYDDVFGAFYLSMVRAGEASGNLADVLKHLVAYLEDAKENRETVVSALIYPAILAFVSILSIVVMLGFVVPQIETLFEDMGEALPPLTQMVISGGDFIESYGVALLLISIALVL
jgi:general secretion pathway protein F